MQQTALHLLWHLQRSLFIGYLESALLGDVATSRDIFSMKILRQEGNASAELWSNLQRRLGKHPHNRRRWATYKTCLLTKLYHCPVSLRPPTSVLATMIASDFKVKAATKSAVTNYLHLCRAHTHPFTNRSAATMTARMLMARIAIPAAFCLVITAPMGSSSAIRRSSGYSGRTRQRCSRLG